MIESEGIDPVTSPIGTVSQVIAATVSETSNLSSMVYTNRSFGGTISALLGSSGTARSRIAFGSDPPATTSVALASPSTVVQRAPYLEKANATSKLTSRVREPAEITGKLIPLVQYPNTTKLQNVWLYSRTTTTQDVLITSGQSNTSTALSLSTLAIPFHRHPNVTGTWSHKQWKTTGSLVLPTIFLNSTITIVSTSTTDKPAWTSGGLSIHPTGRGPFPNRTIVSSLNAATRNRTRKPWMFGKTAGSSAWFSNTTNTASRIALLATATGRRPWIIGSSGLRSPWYQNSSFQAQPIRSSFQGLTTFTIPARVSGVADHPGGNVGLHPFQPTFSFTARPPPLDDTSAATAKTSPSLPNVLVVPSPTPGALPIGNGVAQVGANGVVVVGDQTVAPGMETTHIAGTALFVPNGGGAIVVNGATHTFPQITPPPIQGIVAGGATWTPAGPSAIAAGPNTVSVGDTFTVQGTKNGQWTGNLGPNMDSATMHTGNPLGGPSFLEGSLHSPADLFGGAGGTIAFRPSGVVVANGITGVIHTPEFHSSQSALAIPTSPLSQDTQGLIVAGPAAPALHTTPPHPSILPPWNHGESITTRGEGPNTIADGPVTPDPSPKPPIHIGAVGGGSQNPDPATVQAIDGTSNGSEQSSPEDGSAPLISDAEPLLPVGGSDEDPSNPSGKPSSDQSSPHVSATPKKDVPSSAVQGAPEVHPELDDEQSNGSSNTLPDHRRPPSSSTASSPFVPGPINPDPEAHIPVSPGEDPGSWQSASFGSLFDATQPVGGVPDITSIATTTDAPQQEDGNRGLGVEPTVDTAGSASPISGLDHDPVEVSLPPFQPVGVNDPTDPASSGVVIAGATHTADFDGHITISDQILRPKDPPKTVAGTPIAAVNGGIVLGSGTDATIAPFTTLQATEATPVAATFSSPQPSLQGIILGDDIHPLAGNGDLLLADQTLHPNGPPATISDSIFSLSPSDLVAAPKASGGDTQSITIPILPLLGSPPSKTGASNLYLFSTHYSRDPRGAYLIASQTLVPNGPAITISGTAVSIASDGLQVGSEFYPRKTLFPPSFLPPHTLAEGAAPTSFATTTTTDAPADVQENSFQTFTGAGQVFTVPDPTATATGTGPDDTSQTPVVELLGATITRGAPGKTVSGQLISYGLASYSSASGDDGEGGGGGGDGGDGGNGEIVVMGSSTFSVPASISRFDSSPRGTRGTGTIPSSATGTRKGDDDNAGILGIKRIGNWEWWVWIIGLVLSMNL